MPKMGSLGAKVLHDRNPNIEKVTDEPQLGAVAAGSATGSPGCRFAFKVVNQFEGFLRRNQLLVDGAPASVFQLALNEPDVSMVQRSARRQLKSTNIPSIRLTRKSQHLEAVVFAMEQEEEIRDLDIIPADSKRGLGMRAVTAVGPKVCVWNLNRRHVEMELGCLPDEDWEDVTFVKATEDGKWAVACYNNQGNSACMLSLWDLRLGKREQHIDYVSGGVTCMAICTEPNKNMTQHGIEPSEQEVAAAAVEKEEAKKRRVAAGREPRIDDSDTETESDFTDDEADGEGWGQREGWGKIKRVEEEKKQKALEAADIEDWIESNGGMLFATGSTDGAAVVWNQRGEVIATLKPESGIGHATSLCLSRDGRTMVVGYLEGCLRSFGVIENHVRKDFFGTHEKQVTAMAMNLRATECLSGSHRKIMKWSVKFGSRERTITAHETFVRSIVYGADCFVSGGDDKMIKVWAKNPEMSLLRVYNQHTAAITALAVELDRRNSVQLIVSGTHDGELKISTFNSTDVPELKLAAETLHQRKAKDRPPEDGHRGAVTCVCTNQNGALMASGGADRVVKLWSTAGGGLLKRTFALGLQQPINCLGISDDDSTLVGALSAWDLNKMLRWHLKDPEDRKPKGGKKFGIFGDEVVDLSQQFNIKNKEKDGENGDVRRGKKNNSSVSGGGEGGSGSDEEGEDAAQEGVEHEEEFEEFENGHTDNIAVCKMIRDGTNRVLTGSYDRRVKFFDIYSGELVMACRGHPVGHHHWVTGIDYTLHYVVSGSRDRTVKLWDKEKGEMLHTEYIGKKVQCVAMSPSEKFVVAGVGKELQLFRWTPAGSAGSQARSSLMYQHSFPHSELVHTCAFYNEERILSVSRDEICIWCKETRTCVLRHPSKSEAVTCCVATPNAQIIYGTDMGTVYIGAVHPLSCLEYVPPKRALKRRSSSIDIDDDEAFG